MRVTGVPGLRVVTTGPADGGVLDADGLATALGQLAAGRWWWWPGLRYSRPLRPGCWPTRPPSCCSSPTCPRLRRRDAGRAVAMVATLEAGPGRTGWVVPRPVREPRGGSPHHRSGGRGPVGGRQWTRPHRRDRRPRRRMSTRTARQGRPAATGRLRLLVTLGVAAAMVAALGVLVVEHLAAQSTPRSASGLPPPSSGYTETQPVGSWDEPPGDRVCARRVHRSDWEPRPDNYLPNRHRPDRSRVRHAFASRPRSSEGAYSPRWDRWLLPRSRVVSAARRTRC